MSHIQVPDHENTKNASWFFVISWSRHAATAVIAFDIRSF